MKEEKTYYEFGQLESEGLLDSTGKQGKWKFYDEKGNLHMEIYFKNDVEHGSFKRYYSNGNLAVNAEYLDGKAYGEVKDYYENGHIKEVGEYRNFPIDFWNEKGKQMLKDGSGIKVEIFGASGLDIFIHYFENGKFLKEEKISSAHCEKLTNEEGRGNG